MIKRHSHETESNENDRLTDFLLQQHLIERIQNHCQEYLQQASHIEEAFRDNDKILRCIDDRCPGGMHGAGSLILLPFEEAVATCQDMGVKAITSHVDCGAAAKYIKEHSLNPAEIEIIAMEYAKKLASAVNVPYAGHLSVVGSHAARVAYYDGTGRFDFSKLPEELPIGFSIDRAHLKPEYAVNTEARIAAQIMTSDHGYGQLITSDNPFIFVTIGDASRELPFEQLQDELKAGLGDFRDRIKIVGFEAGEIVADLK